MPKRPYFLDFPCYIIVEGDDIGPHNVCVEGQTCVALFTDSDVLRRYMNQERVRGTTRSFAERDELASYLRTIAGRQSALVTVDPIVTKSVYRIPINELIEELGQG